MRQEFAIELYSQMTKNPDIYVLTGDLGYKVLDKVRYAFPDRFINCGASEQAMVGIAVGLALRGKIPIVYTITSFYLRAAETISLYLSHEQIPVYLVGSGRDNDYKHDGFSHDATVTQKFLHDMDIIEYYPKNKESVAKTFREMLKNNKPSFISLKR